MVRNLIGTSVLVALCATVLAQQPDTTDPATAPQKPATERPRAAKDITEAAGAIRTLAAAAITNLEQTHIAAGLLLNNQEEIIVSEFADSRVKSDDVKAFARMMVKQHGQTVAKVEALLPSQVVTRLQLRSTDAEQLSGTEAAKSKRQRSPYTVMRPAEEAGEGLPRPLLDMDARIAQNRIKLVQSELSQHQGKDFDAAYMGFQIGAHINMLAELMAVEPLATGELKRVVTDSQEVTKQHLAEAKKIMEGLSR